MRESHDEFEFAVILLAGINEVFSLLIVASRRLDCDCVKYIVANGREKFEEHASGEMKSRGVTWLDENHGSIGRDGHPEFVTCGTGVGRSNFKIGPRITARM